MSGPEEPNPLENPPIVVEPTQPEPAPLWSPVHRNRRASQQDFPGPNEGVDTGADGFLRGSAIAGHEEILYGAPQDVPVNNPVALMDYLFWALLLFLLIRMVAAIFIIVAYNSATLNFAPLILFLFLAQFAKIAVDGYFLSHPSTVDIRPSLRFNILTDLTLALTYLGIYLALGKTIAVDVLPYFIGIHLFFCTVRFCVEAPSNLPSSGGFFMVAEAIQLLIIAFKIQTTDGSVNWTWALLFFYVVAIFLLIIAFFVGLVLASFLGLWLFADGMRNMPPILKWAIASALFLIFWLCFVFYMFVSGFEALAAGNHLGFGNPKGAPDTRLRTAAWIVVISSAISLISVAILVPLLKTMILAGLRKGRAKEVTLKSFAEALNLDVTRVSENFFRPAHPNGGGQGGDIEMGAQNPNQAPLGENEGLCIVCLDKKSDVIIKPCGHGGFCTDCMKEYLKEKEECSLCRAKIEEVYLVVEDPDTHTIKARGVIKLKR